LIVSVSFSLPLTTVTVADGVPEPERQLRKVGLAINWKVDRVDAAAAFEAQVRNVANTKTIADRPSFIVSSSIARTFGVGGYCSQRSAFFERNAIQNAPRLCKWLTHSYTNEH
jgi:hypothetical protein